MQSNKSFDSNLFIERYFALVQDDLLGKTEAGNPQPALVNAAFAYPDSKEAASKRLLPPKNFYRIVNEKLSANDKPLVVFPTTILNGVDVCVMDKSLFKSLMDRTVLDEEASVVLEHASKEMLDFTCRITLKEKPDDEPLH